MASQSSIRTSLQAVQSIGNNLFNGTIPEKIVFHHIPKCGGTAIRLAIRNRYLKLRLLPLRGLVGIDAVASALSATDRTENIPDNAWDDFKIMQFREKLLLYFLNIPSTRYISGHMTVSNYALQKFSGKYAFITVLRDPVRRWESEYFYNKYKLSNHRKINVNILEYMNSESGRSQGYEYVKFLGGARSCGDYTSRNAINRAKENLDKLDLVGFLEYQEDLISRFKERFGVVLRIPRNINVNPAPNIKKTIVTPEIKERIELMCQPDREIYQYALDRFLTL